MDAKEFKVWVSGIDMTSEGYRALVVSLRKAYQVICDLSIENGQLKNAQEALQQVKSFDQQIKELDAKE